MNTYPRIVALLLGAAAIVVPLPPVQAATPADDAVGIVISTRTDILWVEATLPSSGNGRLTLKLYARKGTGGWTLWQSCSFNAWSAGTYRCGLDASAGTHLPGGRWKVRALIEDEVLRTFLFRLEIPERPADGHS